MSETIQIVEVLVNGTGVAFEEAQQTGHSIKERAGIPDGHILCLDRKPRPEGEDGGCKAEVDELKVIGDDDVLVLEQGERFLSAAPEAHHGVTVTINQKPFEFADPHQTGRSIKERAGIPITDVLFLDRPGEDEVIGDDKKIVLKCGECFHSSPPANYGGAP